MEGVSSTLLGGRGDFGLWFVAQLIFFVLDLLLQSKSLTLRPPKYIVYEFIHGNGHELPFMVMC